MTTEITVTDQMDVVDHACLAPDSTAHHWEVTAAWLAGGLEAGERVVYFEDNSADAVLDRLADDRVPVGAAIADGQLVIVDGDVVRAACALPVDQITGIIRGQIEEAAAGGWPGLRLSGESTSILDAGGLTKVVAYERAVDVVLREHPSARMLCRFDRRYFDDEALTALRAAHRSELVTAPPVFDDTVLRVTVPGPSMLRLAGEVDHSNRHALGRVLAGALADAQRSHSAPTDITVDVSALRFLDVGGAVELVQAVERFPQTHRIVLDGARPRVARVLDRCGAPFAQQLGLRPRGDR